MSRQVTRQMDREAEKQKVLTIKRGARKAAKAELLERQSAREKAGFYEGQQGTGMLVSPSRSRLDKRVVKKGQAYGRIIREAIFGGKKFALHATKGWRLA